MTMHQHINHADHLQARAQSLIERAQQNRKGGHLAGQGEQGKARQQSVRNNLSRGLSATPILGDMSGWVASHG